MCVCVCVCIYYMWCIFWVPMTSLGWERWGTIGAVWYACEFFVERRENSPRSRSDVNARSCIHPFTVDHCVFFLLRFTPWDPGTRSKRKKPRDKVDRSNGFPLALLSAAVGRGLLYCMIFFLIFRHSVFFSFHARHNCMQWKSKSHSFHRKYWRTVFYTGKRWSWLIICD